ncbi:hypothetical protein [uncultured Clostridium sp.]|uniref:hypothetical protein n=1 Tax=uncultured Clostridium sp. TaxID=59620 RepID=UPI0025866C98|nr:hypothetical protein [uncultured Clostridium sp.]MDU1350600.1 hypothetical protein [Clostridium argentinense]
MIFRGTGIRTEYYEELKEIIDTLVNNAEKIIYKKKSRRIIQIIRIIWYSK